MACISLILSMELLSLETVISHVESQRETLKTRFCVLSFWFKGQPIGCALRFFWKILKLKEFIQLKTLLAKGVKSDFLLCSKGRMDLSRKTKIFWEIWIESIYFCKSIYRYFLEMSFWSIFLIVWPIYHLFFTRKQIDREILVSVNITTKRNIWNMVIYRQIV